jgi:hypothetical protein
LSLVRRQSFYLFPFYFYPSSRRPKDFTALGGKVGRAGPGVEAEEGEGVEVGREGVKLLTLGVGETDQDAVLQAGKAQVDSVKIASQQLVFKVLNIVGGLGGGGVEPSRPGLLQEVVNEMDELGAGLGYFGDHGRRNFFLYEVPKFASERIVI